MKRCKDCRYPGPLHKPECQAREQGLKDVRSEAAQARLAVLGLLRAIGTLPPPIQSGLIADEVFMAAFRTAKGVIS